MCLATLFVWTALFDISEHFQGCEGSLRRAAGPCCYSGLQAVWLQTTVGPWWVGSHGGSCSRRVDSPANSGTRKSKRLDFQSLGGENSWLAGSLKSGRVINWKTSAWRGGDLFKRNSLYPRDLNFNLHNHPPSECPEWREFSLLIP